MFRTSITVKSHSSPLTLLPSVAQDMTQSWPSQQALGGDRAQRMLYNPKVLYVCVLCSVMLNLCITLLDSRFLLLSFRKTQKYVKHE